MNPIYILTSLLLIAPASVVAADAAVDDCAGTPCDVVNRFCDRFFGNQCLGVEVEADDCMGPACEAVNEVCMFAFGASCVEQGSDDALMCQEGPHAQTCYALVEAYEAACGLVADGKFCMEAVVQTEDGMYCLTVEPWYGYCSAVVGAYNSACDRVADGKLCIEATAGSDANVQCITVEPWYQYCRAVAGAIETACDIVLRRDCIDAQEVEVRAPVDCTGAPCDTLNAVCHAGNKYLPDPCVK